MLKKIISLFIVASFSALIYSCACECGEKEMTKVPENVLKNADEFISSRTGEEFFSKYISIDLQRTEKAAEGYHLVYRLIIPEKPYVNEVIEFSVNETGEIKKDKEIIGIPDCPEYCGFNIDEEAAVRIAKDAGLAEGIKEWKTGFMWEPKYDKYVWRILSTTYESKGSEGYRGDGEEILIDPNSGEIIVKQEWHVR